MRTRLMLGLLVAITGVVLLRRRGPVAAAQPEQIAPGVWWLETGRGLTEANVYFVRSGPSWVLIDAAWPNRGTLIAEAAQALFGADTRPAAMFLTHIHPDHSGSTLELALRWAVPVFVHPDELPLAAETYLPEYANPLDRWLVSPLLHVLTPRASLPRRVGGKRLEDVVRPLNLVAGVPGLPDWECVPTPGHTPGHVSCYRASDRVLIAGDALLTVNTNSLWDFIWQRPRVSLPPYIATWNWPLAKESAARLAFREPLMVAGGHGRPLRGPILARDLRALRDRCVRACTGEPHVFHHATIAQ